MDYMHSGNSFLFWGQIALASGAFITSLAWYILPLSRQMNGQPSRLSIKNRKLCPILSLFVLFLTGSILLAHGGKLVTQGWDLLNKNDQKKTLIRAVTREWLANELAKDGSPLSYDPNSKTSYGGEWGVKHLVYRRMSNFSQIELLTSSLFSYKNKDDAQLLLACHNYSQSTNTINEFFAFVNTQCTELAKLPKKLATTKRREVYEGILSENLYRNWLLAHNNLKVLLKEHYPWVFTEYDHLTSGLNGD